MTAKCLLVSGSAADDSPREVLQSAVDFIRALVRSAWRENWRFVTLGSNEPRHPYADDLPLVFDWIVVDEVRQLSRVHLGTGLRLHVVSAKKLWAKVSNERMATLLELEREGVAGIEVIPDDLWLGGRFRDAQVGEATALVCIGGGKGVSDQAHRMMTADKPVLPVGLELQGITRDGCGARQLSKSFIAEPAKFLRATGASLGNRMFGLDPRNGVGRAADEHVRLLEEELKARRSAAPVEDLVLTVIPIELEAAASVFERHGPGDETKTRNGTRVRLFTITRRDGQTRRVGLVCVGSPGTAAATAVVGDAMSVFKPHRLLLAGIAAGQRGKRQLGETVVSDEVVAYELAARVSTPEGSVLEPRPHSYRPDHSLTQAVTLYLSAKAAAQARVAEVIRDAAPFPKTRRKSDLSTPRLSAATIAAGDKLARDASMWLELKRLHGKIDVLEMEGAGVAEACRVAQVPFLLFRGISDHGDEKKNDAYHRVAAFSAAAFVADFIIHGPD
jgi:nucleoside phosphorylase